MTRLRVAVAIALLSLAGCASDPPHIMATTPSMVSICLAPYSRLDDGVQLAQRECARSGKNATLINHGGQCLSAKRGLEAGEELDFRCE